MDGFEAGLQVRLKADVGRIGFCTGKVLERGEKKHIQVQFPKGPQYIPVDQLEIISNIQEH